MYVRRTFSRQKKRVFKVFKYRGIELDDLLKVSDEQFKKLVTSDVRRRLSRHMPASYPKLLRKLAQAKQNVQVGDKPRVVKTYLRDIPVVPEMIGSTIGVYNGKSFITVEIRPEMVGHFLKEFSLSYKPVLHKGLGHGATRGGRFVPLK